MTSEHRHSGVEREAQAVVERLGGRWSGSGGLCRCPAHDDRKPSLSVRAGRSRMLLHCFAGCEASDVLRALTVRRLIGEGVPPAGGTGAQPAPTDAGCAARRLWGAARDIAGTPAADYLAARALRPVASELRFHPRAPHGPRPLTQFRPAMIAAVRDEEGLVAVHRTFLDPCAPRLAGVANPKCALGRLGRGAVRLGRAAARLGLAEGIETALSASLLFNVPCWATLGTERFGRVAIPPGVKTLLLFLDNDAGGRRAEALARQAFGCAMSIEAHYPARQGADWNDVLREAGGTYGG